MNAIQFRQQLALTFSDVHVEGVSAIHPYIGQVWRLVPSPQSIWHAITPQVNAIIASVLSQAKQGC